MKKTQLLSIAAIAAALALSSLNADARAGGGGGGRSSSVSSSRSSSTSSVSRSSTTSSSSSSSRAGSGSSSGMTRSSVMQEARSQSPQVAPRPAPAAPSQAYVAPAATPTPAPANSTTTANGQRGYSGGQLLGAAAAGAVGGYLLHGATHPGNAPVVVNNGGGVGTGSGMGPTGDWSGNGANAMVSGANSGIGAFMGFAVLLGLIALGVFMYRRMNANSVRTSGPGFTSGGLSYRTAPSEPLIGSNVAAPSVGLTGFPLGGSDRNLSDELLSDALTLFRKVQDANNREDRAAMAQLADESYLPVLTEDFGSRSEPERTVVHMVRTVGNRVLGFERQDDRYVGSIHYSADISEGNGVSEEVEEVWHFVRPLQGGTWKLAGIEQV